MVTWNQFLLAYKFFYLKFSIFSFLIFCFTFYAFNYFFILFWLVFYCKIVISVVGWDVYRKSDANCISINYTFLIYCYLDKKSLPNFCLNNARTPGKELRWRTVLNNLFGRWLLKFYFLFFVRLLLIILLKQLISFSISLKE